VVIFGREFGFQQPDIDRNIINDQNPSCHWAASA
jgi:hypothetical protein